MPHVRRVVAICGLMLLPAGRADAQSTLPDAASPLGRAQAVELLGRYLRGAEERGLDITAIREVEPGKGFVELTRRYVVSGTAEVRRETLFLGYRLESKEWRLAELRSAP